MGISISQNSAKRIAAVVKKVEGTPNDNVGTPQKGLPASREFWAKLTGNGTLTDGRHKYSWEAVLLDEDGFKDYDNTDNIRKGDLTAGADGIDRYALDVVEWPNTPLGEAVPNDRVVRMFVDYYTDADGKTLPRFTFSSGGGGSLPSAQYQHMVVGYMVSQNQMGASFILAHPME